MREKGESTCGQIIFCPGQLGTVVAPVSSRAFYLLILLQAGMFLSTLGGNIGNSQNLLPTMFYTSSTLKY